MDYSGSIALCAFSGLPDSALLECRNCWVDPSQGGFHDNVQSRRIAMQEAEHLALGYGPVEGIYMRV